MASNESSGTDTASGDGNEDKTSKYLDWLLARLADYGQSIRRNIFFMILLIAAFELVANSKNTEIAIGSFDISKGTVALQFIPAVVAFLFYQIMIDTTRIYSLVGAFMRIFAQWSRDDWKDSRGQLPVMVPLPIFWNMSWYAETHGDAIDSLENVASAVFFSIIILGTIGFQAQASYVLYRPQFSQDLPWLLSVVVALSCLVLAIVHFALGVSSSDD